MSTSSIKNVCIVGSGFMGSQIGLQCAVHGYDVCMHDVSQPALRRCAEEQASLLDEQIEAGQVYTLERGLDHEVVDDAGGSAWQLPKENPAHIFRMNPSDRASAVNSTTCSVAASGSKKRGAAWTTAARSGPTSRPSS